MARGFCLRALCLSSARLDDLLLLRAEAVDAELDDVADLEELRLGLHAERDARRGAGDDDVAGLHDEILRAPPDDFGDAEDHRLGVAVLAILAVDLEPDLEVLRVFELVLGDDPRADRAEALAALALGPLA